MSLSIKITGLNHEFEGVDFILKRYHGDRVFAEVTIIVKIIEYNLIVELADKVWNQPTFMEVFWNENSISPKFKISNIISIRTAQENNLKITGLFTYLSPEIYLPRKRILKAGSFLNLLEDNFSKWLIWENHIGNSLDAVEFKDKEKNNHIQDGLSDLAMTQSLITSYNKMSKPEDWIMLSGSSIEPKYKLVWVQEKKYRSLNIQDEKKIDDNNNNGPNPVPDQIIFSDGKIKSPSLLGQNSTSNLISYILTWGDNFNADNWNDWRKKELPLFFRDKFVFAITDKLLFTAHDSLHWHSTISILPKESLIQPPECAELNHWSSICKVEQRSDKEQWITGKLEGFEDGADLIDIRLLTPYSGKDGNKGLHLVPENDTEILVYKGQNWMQPIMNIGNVRSKEIIKKAPYWHMDEKMEWKLNEWEINLDEMEIKTSGVSAKIDSSKMDIS